MTVEGIEQRNKVLILGKCFCKNHINIINKTGGNTSPIMNRAKYIGISFLLKVLIKALFHNFNQIKLFVTMKLTSAFRYGQT